MTVLIKNRSMMVEKKLKKDMHNNFTAKWSKHKHADEHCIYYDQMTLKTEELEPIQLGCTQTHSRLSYYCPNHKNYEF
jgi:hypothetical protein